MSANLIKQWHKLELVCSFKNLKLRKAVLKEFSKDKLFCHAVREIIKNTIQKRLNLSPRDKATLRKKKALLLNIVKKRVPHKRKRQYVVQTGNGILPIVIPLVAQLIGELIRKNP